MAHIGSSTARGSTRLGSGISHCFLYFFEKKSSVANDCCWILRVGREGGREGEGRACPPLWILQGLRLLGGSFPSHRLSWCSFQGQCSAAAFGKQVLWDSPPTPPPALLHSSSSGFSILFSATFYTKLCCDLAVGLDLAKRIQMKPLLSLSVQQLCRALCTLTPFHLLYLILKSVYCKEIGRAHV